MVCIVYLGLWNFTCPYFLVLSVTFLFLFTFLHYLILLTFCLKFCLHSGFLLHFTEALPSWILKTQFNSHWTAIILHRWSNVLFSHYSVMWFFLDVLPAASSVGTQCSSWQLKWWSGTHSVPDLEVDAALIRWKEVCPQRAVQGAVWGTKMLLLRQLLFG